MVAGPVLRKGPSRLALGGHDERALAVLERGLPPVVQALRHPRLRDQPVHHRVDRVLFFFVEADLVLEGRTIPSTPTRVSPICALASITSRCSPCAPS